MRSIVSGAALASVTTLLTLGLLELGARAVVPPALPRTTMYRPAPDVAYELAPGWEGRGPLGERIRVDHAGMRGPEIRAERGSAIRVVMLGDSFTFGIGVEEDDALPAALGRALPGALAGRPVEVLNAGVPGYNLFQERRALDARVAALAPDAIIVGFVENDLYNVDGSDFVAAADGGLLPRTGAFEAAVTLNPFAALSGPWLWLQIHSAAFRAASMSAIHRRLAVDGEGELAALAARAEQGHDLPTQLLRGDDDPATTSRWKAAEQALQAMAATVRRKGAQLVLVLLPRPEQLFAPRLRGGFTRIASAASRAGILVVDPTAALAEEHDRIGLYLFPADHHPNARYYARVAELLARAIAAANLLPASTPSSRRSRYRVASSRKG